MSPGVSAKKRHAGVRFTLGCGCKDAKSVSVSAPVVGTPSTTATRRRSAGMNPSGSTTTDTLTITSALSSFLWERSVVEFDDDGGDYGPESFSGLLRELSELEQSVASWGRKSHHQNHDKKHSPPSSSPLPSQEDRKEKNGSNGDATDKPGDCRDGDDGVGVGLDGSVAVVKQSDDPLGEFRQSERARRRRGPSTPRRVPLRRHTDAATRSWLGPRRRRRELPCSHAVTAAAALLPCSRVVVAVAATAATSPAAGPPLPHHPVGRRRRSTQSTKREE
ncbi:hypothetical protein [Oryza sativa Japonica Group]|nr:hypothetical protein [Oryza sativa Japonica Group]